MHFAPREPFPPQSWARCSISRWRDWRAVGGRWSRRRCSADFSGVDVTEFRILNFIDRLSHRGAKSCAVTVDLAQSVVAAGFRTCQHSVEALKLVDLALERLRHHVFHRQLRLLKRGGDFFLCSFLSPAAQLVASF